MAENSGISWTDHTHNHWIGCDRVSPGCDNCYAATQDKFRRWTPEGWGGPRRRTKTADQPRKWNAAHELFYAAHGRRQRVFCSSLSDWADNQVPIDWLVDLLELVRTTPNLDWLMLTKRIGIVRSRLQEAQAYVHEKWPAVDAQDLSHWITNWLEGGEPPHNVWIGATVVNQQEADRDISKLLYIPAVVRFLSIEPILGPVAIHDVLLDKLEIKGKKVSWPDNAGTIDWVIVGAESGGGARAAHIDWIRSLVRQCAQANVPVHVKQLGKYVIDGGFSRGGEHWPVHVIRNELTRATEVDAPFEMALRDRSGSDISEWPEDLRIQQFPIKKGSDT